MPIRTLILDDYPLMVKQFELKKLFTHAQITNLVQNFNLNRESATAIQDQIELAFKDYIISALSELTGSRDEYRQLYAEASFHLQKASKLLTGLPHPAGKMAQRLASMDTTLLKLVDGRIGNAAERANRFMEKNLVRKLKTIWENNTPTPFHVGGDSSGKNPRDFLVACFQTTGQHYPEIDWFVKLNILEADLLIKAIKR